MDTTSGVVTADPRLITRRAVGRPIEVKVTVDVGVDQALAALGDPLPVSTRRIWFIEEFTGPSEQPLQLFSRGIILRVKTGADGDGSTARLWPVDTGDLVGRWARRFTAAATSYSIEDVWSGSDRTTTASVKSSYPRGAFTEAHETGNVQAVFTADQCQLLSDCTYTDLNNSPLIALGPVESTKWRNLWPGVDAERWTVLDLDLLELSIRLTPGYDESAAALQQRASQAQRDLARGAARHGFDVSTLAESKTERVLRALASAARTAPVAPNWL